MKKLRSLQIGSKLVENNLLNATTLSLRNITSLTRKGDDGSDIGRLIDDLTLSYTGNQLKDVTEYAAPVLSEATMNFVKNGVLLTPYKYDSNGNLLIDPSKGASYIWDANNRLQGIDYGEKKASINITRSASGAKLAEISEKFVMGAGFSRITNARHYYGPFEYLDNSLARVNVSGGYIDASGKFHAYVTDWQGNVRAVVCKESSGPVIEQSTWYYPYGMPTCDGRHPSVNRYKYTGKELITDNATNLYDYTARLYDPALCRWITTDPMQEHRMDFCSYSYCLLDPINLVDPDGKREWPVDSYKGKQYRHGNDYLQPRKRSDGSTRPHKGVDINIGSESDDLGAPVYATHDGIVVRVQRYTDDKNGGGTRVKIQSKNGKVATFYMHLQDISKGIKLNAMVSEGQQIGTIGGTGNGVEDAYTPHLHYELFIDDQHTNPAKGEHHLVDPQLYLEEDNNNYPGGSLQEITVYGIGSSKKYELSIPPTEVPDFLTLPKK